MKAASDILHSHQNTDEIASKNTTKSSELKKSTDFFLIQYLSLERFGVFDFLAVNNLFTPMRQN